MKWRTHGFCAALVALAITSACNPPDELPENEDAGGLGDAAAVDASADASAALDASATPDAAISLDAGPPVDAGVGADAGPPVDAGDARDAAVIPDAAAAPDASVPADAGVDAGRPSDAGVPPPDAGVTVDELLRRNGVFFTPTTAQPSLTLSLVGRGITYKRVQVCFDFDLGDWQEEIPDEGSPDRTEYILFGLFRNAPNSWGRYLMGAAPMTKPVSDSRRSHFKMFGRVQIASGSSAYTADTGFFAWEHRLYNLCCTLDGVADTQVCRLSANGNLLATRSLSVTYLDPATHLSSGLYLEMSHPPDAWGIETAAFGWPFSNLVVRAWR